MTREPIEVTRQDRIYCLKVSSDYHPEVCEECKFYPNCDHMTQDDMTELTIKDLEALEQEPKWIPVSKLPEAGEYIGNVARYYLVQNEYGDMMVASYDGIGWRQMYQHSYVKDKVVAWMPLPELFVPQESEG